MSSQTTLVRRIARALLPQAVRSAYRRLRWRCLNWWLWDFSVSPNFILFVPLSFFLTRIQRQPVVAVYQPGRVGSSAVTAAIRIAGAGLTFHVHSLAPDLRRDLEQQRVTITPALAEYIHQNDKVARCLRWVLGRHAPIKIVVLLRDPVGQSVSHFFYNFTFITGHSLDEKAWTLRELWLLYWIKNAFSGYTLCENWFDREMHRYTGFDIFAHTFDSERGWQVYQHNRLSVLVMKIELDDADKNIVLNTFLGIKNLQLQVKNTSEEQSYSSLYRAFRKDFSLQPERLDTIYAGRYARHFYTLQEIEGFKQKWMKKRL
jgi:hypothetical protein